MTKREVDRLEVIQRVDAKTLRQREAAAQLGLGVRQVGRLLRDYRARGAEGLVSRRRGKPPSNAIDPAIREAALALVRENYADFGPTLAAETLGERHGITLSRETLRQWMAGAGLWTPGRRRAARVHQGRPRRARRGELVQADGSPHDWFEGRGPACTLIVFIDDATSELLALRFSPSETTEAYMETLDTYLGEHGRPVALYTDKYGVFRVNKKGREGDLTQFGRALRTLDIGAIHANTPQAKGRVERYNGVLQDRLVKAMRLDGISDIDAANAWLPAYMERHNARFAVAPASPADAHRPVLHKGDDLALILCQQHTRKLSKNLTFQFRNREYQVRGVGKGYRLRHAQVTVCVSAGDSVTVLHKGRALKYRVLAEGEAPAPSVDEKGVNRCVDEAMEQQRQRPRYKPAPDHPWRRGFVSAGREPA